MYNARYVARGGGAIPIQANFTRQRAVDGGGAQAVAGEGQTSLDVSNTKNLPGDTSW